MMYDEYVEVDLDLNGNIERRLRFSLFYLNKFKGGYTKEQCKKFNDDHQKDRNKADPLDNVCYCYHTFCIKS